MILSARRSKAASLRWLLVTTTPSRVYFRKGVAAALDSAHAFMTAGAHAVKLEGVDGHEDVIQRLVGSGIPVMGHLGLQPQSVHAYGGFRVQGRSSDSARGICCQARALEELGVFAIVLE